MTPLPKMYPKDTAPQEVWMSNCRFHYLSSKQTGKFTNLQIPMVGRMETANMWRASKAAASDCLGKRLRCGSQSLSTTWTTA